MGDAILTGIAAVPVLLALQLLWNRWQTGKFFCIRLPRPYRDHRSQETVWDERYEQRRPPEVDRVLNLICETFLFHPDNQYKLGPDDRLLDIYRACYPRPWSWFQGDCMEIESILMELDIAPDDFHSEITLADLVDLSIRNSQAEAQEPGGA